MNSNQVRIIDLTKVVDARGNLSVIEASRDIPFDIARTYWIYDVPGGERREGHAFREQHEFIVSLSGSFDVVVDDGIQRKTYSLNRSYYGLYIPPMMWRELSNFSTNALGLVLSSTRYDATDYIEVYADYLNELAHAR